MRVLPDFDPRYGGPKILFLVSAMKSLSGVGKMFFTFEMLPDAELFVVFEADVVASAVPSF